MSLAVYVSSRETRRQSSAQTEIPAADLTAILTVNVNKLPTAAYWWWCSADGRDRPAGI